MLQWPVLLRADLQHGGAYAYSSPVTVAVSPQTGRHRRWARIMRRGP